MIRILAFFIAILSFQSTKADCLTCWELRKVEITMTSGETVSGYIKWNETWLNDIIDTTIWKNKFPESVLPYYQKLGFTYELELFTEIFIIKNDSIDEFIATKPECQGNLDYTKIKSVRELDKGAKIYHGAEEILIFSQRDIDRLKTNPYSTFYYDSSLFGTNFLSYNKAITRNEFSKINEDNYDRMVADFKAKGVIVYTVGY